MESCQAPYTDQKDVYVRVLQYACNNVCIHVISFMPHILYPLLFIVPHVANVLRLREIKNDLNLERSVKYMELVDLISKDTWYSLYILCCK